MVFRCFESCGFLLVAFTYNVEPHVLVLTDHHQVHFVYYTQGIAPFMQMYTGQ
jgi:hypothetical protein